MGGIVPGDATCWGSIFMADSSAKGVWLDPDSPEREQDPPKPSAPRMIILQTTSVPLLFCMVNSFMKACRKPGAACCLETGCEMMFTP